MLHAVRRFAVVAVLVGWLTAPPAFADFLYKTGSFTKSVAAAPVSQPVTGLGFRPKAVIFSWTRQTAADAFNIHIQAGYGFATGPANERAVAIASDDGSLGGNTGKGQWQANSIVLFNIGTPTVGAQAELTSLDADGFTLNWTLNEARADIIHYIALGGSDLSRATVGSFTKNAGTGNDPITGVGFQPDFLMLLGSHMTAPDSTIVESQLTLGFASGPTQRASVTVQLEDGAGIGRNTCVQQRADRVYLDLNDNGSPCTEDTRFDLVSFDPDGFTVNRELNNASGQLVHYLALKGGQYRVGSFNKSTAAAPVDDPVAGVGFAPVGVMLASKNLVTNLAAEAQGRISFGAGDGATEVATWWHDANAITADANERTSTSKIAVHATSPATLNAEADLKSLDNDGFTLTWTTNNAVAHEMLYVAFGTSGAPFEFRKGSFSKSGGVGLQKVTSVGFRPKALLFFWTRQSNLDVIEPNVSAGYGFATGPGTGQASIAIAGDDAVGGSVSDTGRWHSPEFTGACSPWPSCAPSFAAILMISDGTAPTLGAEGRLTQMLNNGFEIDWVSNDARTDLIHYVALGGTDITNALVDGFDVGSPATGNLPVTTGFQPDFVMFLSPGLQISNSIVGKANVGFASGPAERGTVAVTMEAGFQFGGRDSCVEQYPNKVVVDLNNTCTAPDDKRFDLVSFDPTGFTVGRETNISNGVVHYLALKGGKYKVGSFNKSTGVAPATQDVTGVGFRPRGLLLVSGNQPSVAGIQPEGRISMGAGDWFREGAAWWHCKDNNGATSDCNERTTTSKVAVLASQTTLNAEADLLGVLSDGFRLDWTTNNAVAHEILYAAFGPTVPTAVELLSLSARGVDGGAVVEWETASELDNLGFHLHRAEAEGGPYEQITSSLIPGLGSSPTGRRYRYEDQGLRNGTTYFYTLEDVETTGRTKWHGPVSATPQAAGPASTEGGGGENGGGDSRRSIYGDPSASFFDVVERTEESLVLELRTGGFEARFDADGAHLEIPGFETSSQPGRPALPFRRALVEVVAGRKVRLAEVLATEVVSVAGLDPALPAPAEIVVDAAGTVAVARRRPARSWRLSSVIRPFPREAASLTRVVFQGDVKKAELELWPLRWDGTRIHLARRLRVKLSFAGREEQEKGWGGAKGRRRPLLRSRRPSGRLAALMVKERGLYRVSYEDLFGPRRVSLAVSKLHLSRQGQAVAFHVVPESRLFSPSSSLYFFSEGSAMNPYGDAVYELEVADGGLRMPVDRLSPRGLPLSEHLALVSFEENKYYQAGLLEAEDLWQWDLVMSPTTRTYPFTLAGVVASTSTPGRLSVSLQGASDFDADPDHHLVLRINGAEVAQATWDGKRPRTIEADVDPAVLHEGTNELQIENVGDTQAAYSAVYLDRFSLSYPRLLVAEGGRLEGRFLRAGRADVSGLGVSLLLDLTDAVPRWIEGGALTPAGFAFSAEAGRRYLALSPAAVLRPDVIEPLPSSLRSERLQADYLVIGPSTFLDVARPLLDLRESQGLSVRAVPLEEVAQEFGHGETNPQAIRDFLAYAYHEWRRPSPRYVVLLGDASYDPKDNLRTGVKDHLPTPPVRTSFLWTASDPFYAAVNGEDDFPDLALGRLSASSVEEAERMVRKVVEFESSGQSLTANAVLVADNPDLAGNFERDADEIARGVLGARTVSPLYLSRLGASTRGAIFSAFNQGASLFSYIGHGGTVVWASENVFNIFDVRNLSPQPRQPLLLTMNCLNGFFHFPPLNSLAEELVKAEGKGAIAAFAPSGLSLNDAAHVYHKALLGEIVSGRHQRLGDAVLAAQVAYADSGAFPELLSIYHLLGDPALRIR